MKLNSTFSMLKIIFSLFFFFMVIQYSIGQTQKECYRIALIDTTKKKMNLIYFNLIKKGFLIPTINLSREDSLVYLDICPGIKFQEVIINSKNIPSEIATPKEIGSKLNQLHNELINNGFPFANIKLDSIHFEKNKIYSTLKINKGPYFEWGDLVIKGNANVNENLIRTTLKIKKNEPYSEESFSNIENKLSQFNYLSSIQKPELLFENGKVNIYLYLANKTINNISGTVGLQQNITSQKYFLIGDLKMKLVNQLKKGESFDLQWRRIQENTQSLKVGLNLPSLFKSNFGLDNQFNLYKKDSTFLELKNQFGIQYFTPKGFLIKANYKFLESTILNMQSITATIGKSVNYFYGLSLSKQKLDYLPAPQNGFQFMLDISLGKRSTSRNDSLNYKFDNTFKTEYQFTHYLSIFKRNIIKTQISGEIYLAPFYYQNEMLRFGGLLNQRGFREDELLGNIRLTQSVEYRFMLEQNSYLFAFYDLSYYENHVKNKLKDTPYGFGSGISFGTSQGIFSISYALGKQLNNPLLLRNGIIHFGYISYF